MHENITDMHRHLDIAFFFKVIVFSEAMSANEMYRALLYYYFDDFALYSIICLNSLYSLIKFVSPIHLSGTEPF